MKRRPVHPTFDAVVELSPRDSGPQRAWATAKRTYRIETGRLAPVEAEPLRHDLRDPERDPKWPPGSDFWPFKAASDVVVLGKAFGPHGRAVEQRRVSVRVGKFRKAVQVFGRRFVEWSSDGRPRLGAPETFTEMELAYTNAYGGVDRRVAVHRPATFWEFAERVGAPPGAYPRNQSGKGYLVIDDPIDGIELPNLEDPTRLLTADTLLVRDPTQWYQQPLSWFLDWHFPAMFPRAYYVGAPLPHPMPRGLALEEVTRGVMPEAWRELRRDPRKGAPIPALYFQEASLGLTFSDLREGTPIEIEGMHPERERLELALPRPPVLEIDVDGDRQSVAARILHVVLFPNEEKAEITWVGIRESVPRTFIPGIHGQIPISVHVDGTPVPHETPEPIYEKLKRGEAEGRHLSRPLRRRPGAPGHVEVSGELLVDEPPQRERDQVAYEDAPRFGAVDPIAGRSLVREADWVVPGPVPFVFERFYSSSMAWRSGALGRGWSHCLEQCVWEQDGWVLHRNAQGQEIGVPAPGGRELGIGGSVHHPVHGLTITRVGGDAYEVRGPRGARAAFTRIGVALSAGPPRALLTRITGVDGAALDLRYDTLGRLERLALGSGQYVRFEHDERGRLTRVFAPTRDARDWVVVARYELDAQGQLREAADGADRRAIYRYRGRLLTEHRARSGLLRRFTYDGDGARARCVAESWGPDAAAREVLFSENERVVGLVDALGRSYSVRVTATHQAERVLDWFANETTRTYDETTGLLSQQVTPDGETLFLYDAQFHLADVSAPGGTIALEHDATGRITAWTDADGGSVRWAWDSIGRLAAAVDRVGSSVIYDYDGEGPLASVLVPGEMRLALEREPTNRAVLMLRTTVGERRASHDALSRIVTVTDEASETTRFHYDPCGRVSQVELPTGNVVALDSDAEGRVIGVRDDTRRVSIERDGFGRLLALAEAEAGPRLHRDAEGRVSMVESEAFEYWELARDAAGRVIEETGYGDEKRFSLRDHAGRVSRAVGSVVRTEVARDAMGRPTRLEHASGLDQRFEWTKGGRLAGALEGDRRVALQRDGEGRPLVESQDEHWVRSVYDACGRRVAFDSSLGLTVRIERDVLGGPLSIVARQGAQALELRFERDACGRERLRHLPGGLRLAWKRDGLGRAVERSLLLGERQLISMRFGWRGIDRLVRVEESQRGATDRVHDARGRLVSVRMGMGGVERALDDVGNVYRVRERDDHRYAPGGRVEEAYGIEYRYDGDGRRIEKKTALGDVLRYRWDALGRLLEVALTDTSRVVYDYDALGRRVRRRLEQKTVIDGLDEPVWEALRETRYVWDGLSLLHEIDGDGVTTWLWEGGELVGKLTADGAFSVITDPLGVPTELIDAAGNLAWRGSVDVFGVEQRDLANTHCPWRFPGHYEDPDTGLSHALFRVYDPETAAYLTPSPLGVAGGPNLYAYLPDPFSESSPLGLGRGYATFAGELRSERLTGEIVDIVVAALDRGDGAAGPRARFDPEAARITLPDPEAELWGPWERYRPARQLPPSTSSFLRLPDYLGLRAE